MVSCGCAGCRDVFFGVSAVGLGGSTGVTVGALAVVAGAAGVAMGLRSGFFSSLMAAGFSCTVIAAGFSG